MPLNKLTDKKLLKALRDELKECCITGDAPLCYEVPSKVKRIIKEIEKRLQVF